MQLPCALCSALTEPILERALLVDSLSGSSFPLYLSPMEVSLPPPLPLLVPLGVTALASKRRNSTRPH